MRRVIGLSAILTVVMMLGVAPASTGFLGASQAAHAATCGGTPNVTTDKPDYVPGQTVVISGSGYDCTAALTVKVTSPGGVVTTIQATTDSNGAFTATYTIPTIGNETTYTLQVFDAGGNLLASTTFQDTHFRYAHFRWDRPNPATGLVQFTLKVGYRDDYPWQCVIPSTQQPKNCSGAFSGVSGRNVPAAGDSVGFNTGEGDVQFGDGVTTTSYGLHIDAVNTAQDWFSATAYTVNGGVVNLFIPHTYTILTSTYTAFFEGCCRLSTLADNQHDQNWRVNTLVNLASGDPASPASSLTPIVNCGRGSVCHFFLPVTDNDVPPNTVAERLSTFLESGLPSLPPGLSINPATGLFTWNTTAPGADSGGLNPLPWAAQATISELNGSGQTTSTIAVDFLLVLITDTPPAFVSPPASPQSVVAGSTISFPVEASNPGTPTETVSVADLGLPGSATLTCPTPANDTRCTFSWTPVPADVGSHLVTFTATNTSGLAALPITVTINVQTPLTITADNQSIAYGDAPPSFTVTYNGFVNGDTPTTPGALNGTLSCGTSAITQVGDYPITCSGVTSNRYVITFAPGTLHVGQRLLTVTPDNISTVYGSTPTFTYTITGFAPGENASALTSPPSCTSTGIGGHVGNVYSIACSGGAATNYTFQYNTASLKFTQAPLTIAANPASRQYAAPDPAFSATLTGLTNGDTSSVITNLACSANDAATSHVSGNPYTITCTSDRNPDYSIIDQPANLIITAAPLTVTADNQSQVYGAPLPPLTFTVATLRNGDIAAALGPVVCSTTAAGHVAGSPYPITCSGATDTDYSYNYVDGKLTVTAAALTGKADDKSKVYGDPVPAFTATFTGLVNGDSPPAVSCTSTGDTTSHVGTYPIMCSPTANSDYTATMTGGTLTVTAAPLTITADDKSKVYGDPLPSLTASYTGLVNHDTAATSGLGVICSTTATAASHVAGSPYPITCSGATDADYAIGYTAGSLTVTPAPLTVKADDKAKMYGDALPALTASFTGLTNGDSPPDVSCSTTGAAGSHVGMYPITCIPAANTDYTPTTQNGSLSVTPAALKIKADDKSKAYGAALPAFTVSYITLLNGDTPSTPGLAVTCTTTATPASHVAGNPYPISCSGASDPDYSYSYLPGVLTITPGALIIQPSDTSMVYGGTAPTFVPTYSSFVNGDTTTSLATQPTCSSTGYNAGTLRSGHVSGSPFAITCTGAVDPDYVISYAPGKLTITPAPLTLTADNQSAMFSDLLPTLTWHANFVNGDGAGALTTAPACTTTATVTGGRITSPSGAYPITCGGAVPSSDYTIAGYNPGSLTVGQEDLTLTYAGDTFIAQGGNARLATIMTADGGMTDSSLIKSYTLVANSLTLKLGSQSCSPTSTDANGVAACTINGVTTPPGSVTVTMSFSGDTFYASATGSGTTAVGGSLYSLDRTISGAVATSGNGCIAVGGVILVNSSSSSAVQSGHGCNGNSISPAPTIRPGLVSDPLAALTLPSFSGSVWRMPDGSTVPQGSCNASTKSCSPGVYPGGISLSGQSGYTLRPGAYILSGGGLQLSGQASLTGTGVFLYNSSQSGACGPISLSGQAQVSLGGMTSGPYQGLALAQDRSCKIGANINGNGVLTTTGGVYLPAVQFQVSGNGSYQGSLSEMIVDALQVTGNGVVKVNHT